MVFGFAPAEPEAMVEDEEEDAGRDRAKAAVAAPAGDDADADRERSVVEEKACRNQPVSPPDISARRAGDPRLLLTLSSRRFCCWESNEVTRLVGRSDVVLERDGRGV